MESEGNKSLKATVSCPTCQNKVAWIEANRYRPFCSERCKLIDLGSWADESYSLNAVEEEYFSENNEYI